MGNQLSKQSEKFGKTIDDLNTVFEGYITGYTAHILLPDKEVPLNEQKIDAFAYKLDEVTIVKLDIEKSVMNQIKRIQNKYHHNILEYSDFANAVAINYNKASIESKSICEKIENKVRIMMNLFNREQKKYHKFNQLYNLSVYRDTQIVYIKELGDSTFYQSNRNIYLEILQAFVVFLRDNISTATIE